MVARLTQNGDDSGMHAPGVIWPAALEVARELRGERVLLRCWRDDDAEALYDMVCASREHLAPWMAWLSKWTAPVVGLDYVRHSQARWQTREDFSTAIISNETGKLVGSGGLHRIDWSIPSVMIGYWVRPDCEGKGYITEAVKLLTRFAFRQLHAQRVWLCCDEPNVRSAAVPIRLGFVHEGTLRNDSRAPDGKLRNTRFFALTPADFEQLDWK